MIRQLLTAAAIAAAAISAAPSAAADDPSGRYSGDVPGMNYDASLNAPCDNTDRFIFGRGPGGFCPPSRKGLESRSVSW